MTITALIDYFIHPVHFKKPAVLRRARLLVRSSLLTSLFSNSYIWLSFYFEYELGVYLMVFNVFGFLFLSLLVKTKFPLPWLGNLYVAVGAFAIVVLTYFSGGVWSAIYPWIIAIPVLALLVVGSTSGAIWGAISFAAMIWFAVLVYQGVELPVEYNPELRTLWYITVLPGLLLIVLLIGFVFEYTQTKALNDLASKNELLKIQKEKIADQSSELEKHIDDRDYIIRILAHDLNNPLANITGFLALLENEKDQPTRESFLDMMRQSANSAQDLISRVLEMDVSGQRNLTIHMELIEVDLAINKVVNLMSERAKKKNIRLSVINEATKSIIEADRTYFSLIFENLISNAIKFSEPDKHIKVEVSNSDTYVKLKVIDQGPGIREEEKDKLFQKFTKLSARPTAGESSSGLGLSLVKRYVELIKGKVWYEGEHGVGAVFVVEVPLAE